ncbi:SDR family oxidoreductase [Thalassobaculum sp. OXR-137]|uniref:SDR family oxidoreductase n=1 Tax=Thalassobaculum sp. OXR-137 TaxID=3100173 RepID=UPI002AC971C8|nr:SDR family oxidoreductase [Thalassobaculum sp. OXR-137]WPZ36599.1 SDR family oxidoreductase [Thalassobaculum sp. OXR-137]
MQAQESFRDARVVVTAGASGIGLVFARRFAAAGARVALCDVDAAAVDAAGRVFEGAIAHRADVTDEAQMAGFFLEVEERWGGADVVIANAGTGGPAGLIEDLTLDGWRSCLAVNLDGAFLTCRWAARVLKQGGGSLILMSSSAGLHGYPNRSPYATSKWGIIGLMKTLAMELGPHGVRVNAICPGSVEGDRMDRVLAKEAKATGLTEAELRARYVAGVSLRSWVSADDVAEAALFLASPAGAKISGQSFSVDGHTHSLA